MNLSRTRILQIARLTAAAGILAASGWVFADDREAAETLRETGEIVSIESVIASAREAHAGKVLEAELESEDGRHVYEVKILGDEGRLWELHYDAVTGEALESREEDG